MIRRALKFLALSLAAFSLSAQAAEKTPAKPGTAQAAGVKGNNELAVEALVLAASTPVEKESPAALLKKHGIEPDVTHVVAFLRQGEPNQEQRFRIARLIKQLGSPDYFVREKAERQLRALGPVVVDSLRAAAESTDPEVAQRAHRLLRDLDSAGRRRLNDNLRSAALKWLGQSSAPEATPALLDLLPNLPEGSPREEAVQALWARAGPGDVARLRKAVDQGMPVVRAAAIPALELAAGDQAVSALRGYLQDRDEATRLAAARALLDRLPQPALDALLALAAAKDREVAFQAGWLLQQVSGLPAADGEAMDLSTAAERWRTWARTADPGHLHPLGRKRLQMTGYDILLAESFAEETKDIRQAYHRLHYETNVGGRASVAVGTLRLDGQHAEGDQRLYVTADKLLGRPTFPRQFQVQSTLGGEAAEPGAWHVGISVGNIRLLFHPGLEGGAFRAERVDTHQELFGNQTMPFTPGGRTLVQMTVDVRQEEDGDVSLDVRIMDNPWKGQRYHRQFTAKAQDIGDLRRIGLERSGRTGGAALFASFLIRR